MLTTMVKPTSTFALLLLLLLIAIETCNFYRFTDAAKRRIHVSDDLDDIVDDEEDDDWKEWGQKKSSAKSEADPLPPPDLTKLGHPEMQSEMLKYQMGPVFGFVKLRLLGSRRTPDMVSEIALKWTKIAKTGGVDVKFMGVDISTVMFTVEKGQDAIELKDFILEQEDAYELKIGDQLFRRPGDPPFDKVFGDFREDQNQADKKEDKQDEL